MYDDESFGTIVMLVSNNEKKDNVEIIDGVVMPREMHPSRKDWEDLGFTFNDIPGDNVLCVATLPEGWSIKPTDQPMWSDVVDENGITRGDMFYRASTYDRDAHMKLWPRYGIRREVIGKETEIYFGNADEKLFVAGSVTVDFNASKEEIENQFETINELILVAQDFANENYPYWENVHAYWNDNKKVRTRK